jgi:hypothetical protein
MIFFHSHPPAVATYEFHFRQLILAHMRRISIWCAAKTAFVRIAARAAQVPGIVCNSTASFTGMGHDGPPPELCLVNYLIVDVS